MAEELNQTKEEKINDIRGVARVTGRNEKLMHGK